jgi:DNA-binding winged helix-turn-helix (wHTH) protein/TolB-like protein
MKNPPDILTIDTGRLKVLPQQGQLEAGTQSLRLGPVNMRVLVSLIEADGVVVSREELFERVWPNQVISDETLTKCISEIRLALAKLSPDRKFIETIPKKGYRWLQETDSGGSPPDQPAAVIKKSHRNLLLLAVLFAVTAAFITWSQAFLFAHQPTAIALLPIRADSVEEQALATRLEDRLHSLLVNSNKTRVISSEAVHSSPRNPFTYLSSEFGANWVLEGRVRVQQDTARVTLSLVDANTAIVIHTRIGSFATDAAPIDQFAGSFSADIQSLLAR